MKTKILITLTVSSFSMLHSSFGQGTLTPPGPPAPTMKSLDQIEARTAITNSGAVTISQPGSYYLTRNITVSSGNAITIATNGVTLDLNGFTISSTTASATGSGILLNSGLRNITIASGFIQGGVTNNAGTFSGSGFAYGIYYSGIPPVNVLVSRVSVSGCLLYGIYLNLGDATAVGACAVRTVGGYGIVAGTVKGALATDCGNNAIYGQQVSDCQGQTSGSGAGVYATGAQNCYGYNGGSGDGLFAYNAANCYGYSTGGNGLYAYSAQSCYGESNTGIGMNVDSALNCHGYSAGARGIYAYTAENCYGQSAGNAEGIYADTAQGCEGTSDSGTGISVAYTAHNSIGHSGSGIGLNAYATALGCYGESTSGDGLYAAIAIGCVGIGPGASGTYGLKAFIANSCTGAGNFLITYSFNEP